MIVARAHPQAPTDEGWRGARARRRRARRARRGRPLDRGAVRARGRPAPRCCCWCRAATRRRPRARPRRCCTRWRRAWPATRSRSAAAASPRTRSDLPRAASEALLAANVAQGDARRRTRSPFEQTGAYRLLLSAMSENPAELQRFYSETVEPLRRLRRAVRDRPGAHARDVPRGRRQRRGHRPASVHPPPHDLLPPGAGARALRAGRQLQRRAREAQPRPEVDARARHHLRGRARARRPAPKAGACRARAGRRT